ncbi:hypothetical protein DFA_04031 [Cavenderia fasciculata]|uniref:Uncharacterized protein n=1 Tax=Cavenderia fasciculata TaxID=261658 RepID=F4Q136_CACFS|nr:uncharacterized protein DFA_04031 [Cavenderia fasciculata]EGG18537.1 hypothetical protein DFA_04031 [Cavenderia fasciculata]|eukprot:XP_004366441.1 hypothetical protein DFA_04031 [Cavenderia fasciculata]
MAIDKLTVRNACPFPVTFFAIAGPTFELKPNSTQSQSACAIWFTTRVKGPGAVMNKTQFGSHRDDYQSALEAQGYQMNDWEEGGSGVAAGSYLGLAVGEIEWVFKIPNTNNYVDAGKKEGVYGHSNLVILADLDPAHVLDVNHPLWWHLRIETDNGQQFTPITNQYVYTTPNLDKYSDTYFLRVRNMEGGATRGTFLTAQSPAKENNPVYCTEGSSIPYDPLNLGQYWTIAPNQAGGYGITLINSFNDKDSGRVQSRTLQWSSDYSIKTSTDQPDDAHKINATVVQQNPLTVKVWASGSSGVLTAGNPGTPVWFTVESPTNMLQQWLVETYTVDISKIPTDRSFMIKHCKTGLYLNQTQNNDAPCINDYDYNHGFLQFNIEPAPQSGTFYLRGLGNTYCGYAPKSLVCQHTQDGSANFLWQFKTVSHHAGFQIINLGAAKAYPSTPGQDPLQYLFYKEGAIGYWNGLYDDQVAYSSYFLTNIGKLENN